MSVKNTYPLCWYHNGTMGVASLYFYDFMRILLVEDDAALANAVLGYLQGKQFLVDLAADLSQARSMVSLAAYSAYCWI